MLLVSVSNLHHWQLLKRLRCQAQPRHKEIRRGGRDVVIPAVAISSIVVFIGALWASGVARVGAGAL
jgi:hypothetical protein